jgi:nucleoid DNA-binding protein
MDTKIKPISNREIVKVLAERTNLSQKDCKTMLTEFINIVEENLSAKKAVMLRPLLKIKVTSGTRTYYNLKQKKKMTGPFTRYTVVSHRLKRMAKEGNSS